MKKTFLLFAFAAAGLFLLSVPVKAQSANNGKQEKNLRSVKNHVLTSKEMPDVKLKFGKDFKYAGNQDFILYDVARAEQHFFVDTDGKGNIKRLYWIQFEGYLPENNHSYFYISQKVVNIGGLDFYADAFARDLKDNQGRPDSDVSRAKKFLEDKGFRIAGSDVLMQRLVHLVDKEKRNELMIIYLEDMTETGFTAADFAKGNNKAEWKTVSEQLLARAQKDFEISR